MYTWTPSSFRSDEDSWRFLTLIVRQASNLVELDTRHRLLVLLNGQTNCILYTWQFSECLFAIPLVQTQKNRKGSLSSNKTLLPKRTFQKKSAVIFRAKHPIAIIYICIYIYKLYIYKLYIYIYVFFCTTNVTSKSSPLFKSRGHLGHSRGSRTSRCPWPRAFQLRSCRGPSVWPSEPILLGSRTASADSRPLAPCHPEKRLKKVQLIGRSGA